MSRILRRPMFRGGSPNNGGIMSYAQPRKGYAGAGFVNEEEIGGNEDFLNTGTITRPTSSSFFDKDFTETTTTSTDAISTDRLQKKAKEGDLAQKLGLNPLGQRLKEQYLSQRSDPMGKFLINFGLNYMSARPRGGKFGALATAAEAAKKPTEQLYADQDTDRLLKLKLMGALSKSESKIALEKEAAFMVKNDPEKYPDLKTAMGVLIKARTEKKELSTDDRISAQYKDYRSKALTDTGELKDKNKAEIVVRDIEKLGKNKEKLDIENPWLEGVKLQPKANSTDVEIPGATESVLKRYSIGNIYINPNNRVSYEYLGKNIFRPVTKL